MPRQITILGAGIVGTCCALSLQRAGFAVTLIDRDEPGSGCSHGNAGMIQTGSVAPLAGPGILGKVPGMLLDPEGPLVIRWPYLPRLAPWLLRFVRAAAPRRAEEIATALRSILVQAWESYQPLIRDAAAESLIGHKGELYGFRDEKEYAALAPKFALYRRHGVEYIELDTPALRQMEPALSPDYKRGYYLPASRYTFDPHRLTTMLAEDFTRNGGVLLRDEVRGLVLDSGRLKALRLAEREHPVDALVLAAGAFSRSLAAELGVRLPLESLRGYHLMVPYGDLRLQGPLLEGHMNFGVVPMQDGIRLAGTVEMASIDAPPNWKRADMLLPMAKAMLPGLRTEGSVRWMGHRPGMPDSLPVIGAAPGHDNVWFAFGHGTLGLTLAAITGRLVAEQIAGKPASVDLTPFRADRF